MKKMALLVLAGVAFGLGASVATAHPTEVNTKKRRPAVKALNQESPQAVDFFDNFDSYAPGSDIVGQGGWEVWYTGGEHAIVSDDTSNSPSNSLKDHVLSDIVQRFDIHDGQWVLSVMTFCPSDAPTPGEGYIIMMSGYGDAGVDQWNLQVRFDSSAFAVVEVQFGLATTPIILDKWVEFRAEIDLDADTVSMFYDNALLWEGAYTEGVNGTGSTDIACLDLFSNSVDPIYYDDVTVKAAGGDECPPDIDGDTELTLFDFLGFVNLFNAEDPKADWDGDGEFTLFDFLGFVNAFNAGC